MSSPRSASVHGNGRSLGSPQEWPISARPPVDSDPLHVRIEAIEHLLILLLAESNAESLDCVRSLPSCLSASDNVGTETDAKRITERMIQLVERSDGVRGQP